MIGTKLKKLGRALVLVAVVGALVELVAGSAFVAKRIAGGQPFTDLLEQYYLLEPFKGLFEDQYVYPARWNHLYVGDITNPRVSGLWWVGDHLLGHRLAPNVLVTENAWSYRQTNQQGFIVSDPQNPIYEPEPTDGVFRIVMLGGSTVEGNGSSGSLKALPAQLLATLRESYVPALPGFSSLEVINAGVSGFTSQNEYLYYISELRHFSPHLVISYNGWNDQQLQPRVISLLGERAPYFYTSETAIYPAIINGYFRWGPSVMNAAVRTAQAVPRLLRGFAVLDMPYRLIKKTLGGIGGGGETKSTPYSPLGPLRYFDNIELTKFAVERDGARYAWFLQPLAGIGNHPPSDFREKPYLENRPEDVANRRAFYKAASALQEGLLGRTPDDAGFCAADLTDAFDDNPAGVYDDPGHLNDTGNQIVAERIARELVRCGLIVKP
jgi:hypothetical protein